MFSKGVKPMCRSLRKIAVCFLSETNVASRRLSLSSVFKSTYSSTTSHIHRLNAKSQSTASQNHILNGTSRADVKFLQSSESCRRFLDRYDNFLFDCDGVLWENDHVTHIPGISEAIHLLQDLNKRLIYVTNNSTKSRLDLQNKFNEHGFHSPLENVFTNSYACALYLKEFLGVKDSVYLISGEGTKWELDQLGIGHFGSGADLCQPSSHVSTLLKHKFNDEVTSVLVGFDEHFSYNKIFKAASYLMDPNCHFVATNIVEKSAIIGREGRKMKMPLTGVMVNAIAEAAGRQPVIVGKPFNTMFDCVRKQLPDLDLSRTVFIGDSLKADMGFAKSVGIDSALVLTGVNTSSDISQFPDLCPEFVLRSLADIVH
ncbi:hypothetical protein ACF0H5_007232 [Mactra antiquata]